MWRTDSLEKTLMLGKIESRRRRGWQRMRWLDGTTDLMDMSLSKLWKIEKNREARHAAVHGFTNNWILQRTGLILLLLFFLYFFLLFFLNLFLPYFTLQYCIGFAIHWHEAATGVHDHLPFKLIFFYFPTPAPC